VIAIAVVAAILAPARSAYSGPVPTKLDVSGDESLLNLQITNWALDEIRTSKTHALAGTEAPVLQIRIVFASVVQEPDLVGVALAILVTRAAGTDVMRFVSLTNQVVPISMFEATVRSEIKNVLK
jgi:hypothetical protein